MWFHQEHHRSRESACSSSSSQPANSSLIFQQTASNVVFVAVCASMSLIKRRPEAYDDAGVLPTGSGWATADWSRCRLGKTGLNGVCLIRSAALLSDKQAADQHWLQVWCKIVSFICHRWLDLEYLGLRSPPVPCWLVREGSNSVTVWVPARRNPLLPNSTW